VTDRLRDEQVFHDRQAHRRAGTFAERPEKLRFEDEAFLNHETWIRPAFAQLGELQGRTALDYGCGHAMAAVVLARRGARVTAFDLSPGYLDEGRSRARANDVAIDFLQADGHRLPFADRSFDRVWGNAVLHHLDVEIAARELHRVLRPDGIAVFCEPWGENPLLNWARRKLPYPGKERTLDEQPLRWRQVHLLRKVFPNVEVRGFQLLGMARRLFPAVRVAAGLNWCDAVLLSRWPSLERLCRYVVLTLRPCYNKSN
jgi:SAM-dependent methyltransferase